MSINMVMEPGERLSLACTDPATPSAGDPVRFGLLTGICLESEDSNGNATCHMGRFVAKLSVQGTNGGNVAINPGDSLFYVDANTPKLSATSTGYFYGFALEAVGSGLTKTIKVLHVASPGSYNLGAGTVGTSNLAANSVTSAKVQSGGWTGSDVNLITDANVVGVIPVLHQVTVPNSAGAVPVVITNKFKVIDFWILNTGIGADATGDTIQLKNGGTAITDAIAKTATVNAIKRASTMDPAQTTILAGATLNVVAAKTTNCACIAYILGVRIA